MDLLKKEIDIRRKIEAVYNKCQDDFQSKVEFDDYLENKEDIIYKLLDGADVQRVEMEMAEYQRENADNIASNNARRMNELRRLEKEARGETIVEEKDAEIDYGTNSLFGGAAYQQTQQTLCEPTTKVREKPDGSFEILEKMNKSQDWQKNAAKAGSFSQDVWSTKAIKEAMSSVLL